MRVPRLEPSVKSVAIIGGGSSGAAAAKYLLAERSFDSIKVFERRRATGGIWNYTSPNLFKFPDENVGLRGGHVDLITPMYDEMEANIPKAMMAYSDYPFPPQTQLLPSHDTVANYLHRYAEEIRQFVSFETHVTKLRQMPDNRWSIHSHETPTLTDKVEEFDAVIVANGHFDTPSIPPVAGLQEWTISHPNSCQHSLTFRNVAPYVGKKVIVVGNSASGSDIANQLQDVVQHPLLISVRTMPSKIPDSDEVRRYLPRIVKLSPTQRAVTFEDGVVERDVDHIIFCTGYKTEFPFLNIPENLYNGFVTRHLYQHIFYISNPRLAFLAMPLKSVPFPLAESQSAVVARVWSGRLMLPSIEKMAAWDADLLRRHSHQSMDPIQSAHFNANYMNLLHAWCTEAASRPDLADAGRGKMPAYWTPKDIWLRERLGAIKAAFTAKGAERHQICTPEELGFHYDTRLS